MSRLIGELRFDPCRLSRFFFDKLRIEIGICLLSWQGISSNKNRKRDLLAILVGRLAAIRIIEIWTCWLFKQVD